MPPLLQYGFRPFFLLAALYAGLAVPAWVWMFGTGISLPGPFPGSAWHTHEMLFGYLAAVIAGFILTAIPNWTGRLPLSGWPLAGLIALWLAGRVACGLASAPTTAMLIDLAFPLALIFAVWREVVAGQNWRNAPIAFMLSLFALANALHHLANFGLVGDRLGIDLALAVSTVLIALIGGRIVPSFTRNWLVKQGSAQRPAGFGPLDKTALASVASAAFMWVALPDLALTGAVVLLAGTILGARLYRWRGLSTWREPIVMILHVGYAWLVLSLLLLGSSILGSAIPHDAAVHALTSGAIGTMTLAVMTRASLGHTGRVIASDRWINAIYIAVGIGAFLRVAAPFFEDHTGHLLSLGGALWSAAFMLFVLRYLPILATRRKQG